MNVFTYVNYPENERQGNNSGNLVNIEKQERMERENFDEEKAQLLHSYCTATAQC